MGRPLVVGERRQRRVRAIQVHRIQRVEKLRAKLQMHAFPERQWKALEQRQIRVHRIGTEQRVAARVAVGSQRRHRERQAVEPLRDSVPARTVVRKHGVAKHVRPLVGRAA